MSHIPIALIIQLCTIALGFGPWAGAAAGTWYFIGREYAQAEYRFIEHYCGGKRANMPVLAPLREARAWNQKALLDVIFPAIATSTLAYFYVQAINALFG